ncbi:unnamed protein product [Moneuplotes crassus]|uniref:Cyclic nucleotide-binding domain-containing protein n=1 Tax=Euplotes crassus TaxID=5936 RepID=A0AAD2D7V3_EUPCR|nr:unnamed protein product [Moneuplotes crassus]
MEKLPQLVKKASHGGLGDDKMGTFFNTLSKVPEERSKKEMIEIIPRIRSIKFFQEKESSDDFTIDPEIYYLDIIKRLKLEFIPRGEIVFDMGSIGDKFYIILKGMVSILVPGKRAMAKKSTSQGGNEKDEFYFCSDKVKDKISGFFEFIALDDGKSFGEMALMNNKPRGATILCKQDTYFAVMDREDFRGTLMKLEEKVQDTYIHFLQGTALFRSWGHSVLYKLLFAIEKTTFKRGDKIYKQDDPANTFYIVYEGEFTMHKKVEINQEYDPMFTSHPNRVCQECKYPCSIYKKEGLEHFESRRKSPNYHPKVKSTAESVVLIMQKGQIFGLEDSFTEDPKKNTLKKYYKHSVICKSAKARLLVFNKKNTFNKIIYNEHSLKFIRFVLSGKKTKEKMRKIQVKRIFAGGSTLGRKQQPMKAFKNDFVKKNVMLDKSEGDMREIIKEVASGYPKFLSKAFGAPDFMIKREKILYQFLKMENSNHSTRVNSPPRIKEIVTSRNCAKIIRIFDEEYKKNRQFLDDKFFITKLGDPKIKKIISENYKIIKLFYSECEKYMTNLKKSRNIDNFLKDPERVIVSLSPLPHAKSPFENNRKINLNYRCNSNGQTLGRYKNTKLRKEVMKAMKITPSKLPQKETLVRANTKEEIRKNRKAESSLGVQSPPRNSTIKRWHTKSITLFDEKHGINSTKHSTNASYAQKIFDINKSISPKMRMIMSKNNTKLVKNETSFHNYSRKDLTDSIMSGNSTLEDTSIKLSSKESILQIEKNYVHDKISTRLKRQRWKPKKQTSFIRHEF